MIPTKPPSAWFRQPVLHRREPLHVEKDGRIWGHAAGWGECHIGLPGSCTGPPPSHTGYAYMMRGELETSDGVVLPVGHLTMRTGHCNLAAGWEEAAAHYDHTGMVVADVCCGDDDYGIWLAGACRPHLTEADMRELRGADVSGDWRPDLTPYGLELVGLLAVNVPGFIAPRVAVAAGGRWSAAIGLGLIPAGERAQQLAASALIDVLSDGHDE